MPRSDATRCWYPTRDAIELDVVIAIGEAAEVGLGLAETDAIGVRGEGAGGHLDGLAVVGNGGHEVLDHGAGDFGASRGFGEERIHGRESGSDGAGSVSLHGDIGVRGAYFQGDRDAVGVVSCDMNVLDSGFREAGSRRVDGIGADGQACDG
jgi:hypothetical protein